MSDKCIWCDGATKWGDGTPCRACTKEGAALPYENLNILRNCCKMAVGKSLLIRGGSPEESINFMVTARPECVLDILYLLDQKSTQLADVYEDRNVLVLLCAKLAAMAGLPVGVRSDAQAPGWPVVFIELPSGQVSWHIPADAAKRLKLDTHSKEWDGHTTQEKRDRCRTFLKKS